MFIPFIFSTLHNPVTQDLLSTDDPPPSTNLLTGVSFPLRYCPSKIYLEGSYDSFSLNLIYNLAEINKEKVKVLSHENLLTCKGYDVKESK